VISADEDHVRMCAVLGASRFQLFRKLYVPVAVPAVVTALRLGVVYALLGVVGSEIIASRAGVGQLITTYSATLALAPVYALLIVLAAFTSILTMAIGALEGALLGRHRVRASLGPHLRGPVGLRPRPALPAPPTIAGDAGVILRSVSVRFGSSPLPVLNDLSLAVPRGQFVAVVGASGVGKTTILNAVSGLVPAESGDIRVFGRPPRAGRPDVGYMFARDALLPWRTAFRNVELGLEFQGRVAHDRTLRMLELVRLSAAAGKYPSELSQGMRQRVALARTLAGDPEVLLMDEPFAALDALTRSSIRDMFLDIWDNQTHRKTVLFVTHDLTEALVLADRVVTIAGGCVRTDAMVPYGRPRDPMVLAARADYRALYDQLHADLTIDEP
jgi:NitT/TauT family transport system ATP-binding protein